MDMFLIVQFNKAKVLTSKNVVEPNPAMKKNRRQGGSNPPLNSESII